MTELDPEIRALLDTARGADEPSVQDRSRVRARLVSQVGAAALTLPAAKVAAVKGTGMAAAAGTGSGAGTGAAGMGSAGAAATAGSAAGASTATAATTATALGGVKLWVTLGVAGVVGAVGTQQMLPEQPAPAAVQTRQQPAPAAEVEAPEVHAPPARPYPTLEIAPLSPPEPEVDAASAAEPPPEPAPSPVRRRRHPRPATPRSRPAPEAVAAAPAPDAPSKEAPEVPGTTAKATPDADHSAQALSLDAPTPPAAADLQAELLLLQRAQAALRGGLYASALRLAEEHARRFPKGSLARERLGVIALARCANGDDGGPAAQSLLASAPDSPLARRVRRACANR